MTPPAHKPHQTVIFSGCNEDSWSTCGLLTNDAYFQQEMSLIAEDDFSIKIRTIIKLLLSSIHEHTTPLVVKRLKFLRQFDFVRM